MVTLAGRGAAVAAEAAQRLAAAWGAMRLADLSRPGVPRGAELSRAPSREVQEERDEPVSGGGRHAGGADDALHYAAPPVAHATAWRRAGVKNGPPLAGHGADAVRDAIAERARGMVSMASMKRYSEKASRAGAGWTSGSRRLRACGWRVKRFAVDLGEVVVERRPTGRP